jgi:DnaK suppressor protein
MPKNKPATPAPKVAVKKSAAATPSPKKVVPAKKAASKKFAPKKAGATKPSSKVDSKRAGKSARSKPGASYGKADLAQFHENIEHQLQDSREELEALTGHLMDTVAGDYEEENSVYSLHMADQGTDAMEREKDFLQAQRLNDYIKKLEEAIRRVGEGSYGVCVMCAQLIEKPRLLAVPVTQKHVDCKNKESANTPRKAQSRTDDGVIHHFPESN